MKKIFCSFFNLFFLTNCIKVLYTSDLSSQMEKLGVDTSLIIYSQAIDEYPLWFSNSDSIAANIEGKWYKFDLTNIKLIEGNWHQRKIGVSSNYNALIPLTEMEKEEFGKKLNHIGRKIVTKDKTIIELQLQGLSTSLIITKNNDKPKILWTTNLENCHSLVLSSDEKYIAYICELNGLFVMKIK